MSEVSTQQFFGAFVSPFIFRIPPVGFFVGFGPVGVIFSQPQHSSMMIRQICESEYMFLRRIGICEMQVMMEEGYY
jgi:hypothetical protein